VCSIFNYFVVKWLQLRLPSYVSRSSSCQLGKGKSDAEDEVTTAAKVSTNPLNFAGSVENPTHLLRPQSFAGMRSGVQRAQIHHRWPMAESAATKRQVPQPSKGGGMCSKDEGPRTADESYTEGADAIC